MTGSPKHPVTFRIDEELKEKLVSLTTDGATLTSVIIAAIESYVDNNHPIPQRMVSVDQLEKIIPVLKALGKPVSSTQLFQLIDIQQRG